jgi:hypothetical protein
MKRFLILLLSFFLISGFFLLSYAVDQTDDAGGNRANAEDQDRVFDQVPEIGQQ